MAVNKVIYSGETLIDISDSTVTPETLAEGVIAYNAKGERIVGLMIPGKVAYTNLVLTSEEQDSTDVYNGIGYKNGVYASENGDGTDASCVSTGYIPYTWSPSNVIYVRGASITSASHVRFYGWINKTSVSSSAYCTGAKMDTYFTVEELESGTYYKLTPLGNVPAVTYIRISLIGTGENLIITVNEPIVQNGNDEGDNEGDGTYTNLVLTAVSADGETIFNESGYMNGAYASGDHYGTDAECVTTGFIKIPAGLSEIYVKGADWDTSNDHCRLHIYKEGMLGLQTGIMNTFKATESHASISVETLGESYYKFTLLDSAAFVENYYYVISLVGTGDNLIITHDEPIE